MNKSQIKLIAHRGLHKNKEIPENSLLAFKKAIEKNYSIELDINITKDNQIVVFHDEDLKRVCNIDKKIEELDYSFLENLTLLGTKEKIPLLKEVLFLVDSLDSQKDISLIIEIKKHKNIGVLEKLLIEILDSYEIEYFICSFQTDILSWFRKNRKDLKIGLIFEKLPKRFEKYENLIFLYKYLKIKPDFVSLDYKLFENKIFYFCKNKDLEILIWTIRKNKQYDKIYTKISGVIFENITL
ncbi:glycerophosphodiester phosphodiesterase family protein [Arcobacter cloacae]|nr:glycerophosphodiester phosphodiesterase family protein [Arcobacter cloacae]